MAFVGFSLIIIFFVVVLFGILLMGVGIFVLNKQGGEEKNTKKTISIISVSFGAVIIIAAIISAACSVRKVMLFSESHKTYDPLENSDISVRIQAVQEDDGKNYYGMYRQRKLVKLENFQPEQKAENEPWAAFCYSEYKYDYIYKMLNMYGFDMYIIGKDVYAFEDDKDDIISKYTNENILVCEINDSIGSIDIPCSITKDQYEEIKNWNGDQVTVNFKDSHIYFLVLKSFDSVYRENIDLALTPDGEMIRYDSMGLGTLTGVKLSDEQTELIRSYL